MSKKKSQRGLGGETLMLTDDNNRPVGTIFHEVYAAFFPGWTRSNDTTETIRGLIRGEIPARVAVVSKQCAKTDGLEVTPCSSGRACCGRGMRVTGGDLELLHIPGAANPVSSAKAAAVQAHLNRKGIDRVSVSRFFEVLAQLPRIYGKQAERS